MTIVARTARSAAGIDQEIGHHCLSGRVGTPPEPPGASAAWATALRVMPVQL
jgi:hypothetical protein